MSEHLALSEVNARLERIEASLAKLVQPAKPETADILSTEEAAEFLKISPSTLRRLVAAKKIMRAFPHGHPKYRRADLDTYTLTGCTGVVYKTKRIRKAKAA